MNRLFMLPEDVRALIARMVHAAHVVERGLASAVHVRRTSHLAMRGSDESDAYLAWLRAHMQGNDATVARITRDISSLRLIALLRDVAGDSARDVLQARARELSRPRNQPPITRYFERAVQRQR